MGNMKIATTDFEKLMQTIANGWNEGDARKAADCFSEDAIYVEPPEKQLYRGRTELYEFFGGDHGTDIPMRMIWHHLAFKRRPDWLWRIYVSDARTLSRHRDCKSRIGIDQTLARVSISD